ncbi:MAG: mannitol dehydrogenase family protein, partial [Pseudomonadota bacterium]
SMVDCIVPATGEKELMLARSFGVRDAVPVTHENFRQWVIEDDFCAGRPELDRVGVTFAKTVHDYEAMKLRVLNGGHQMIAIPGDLLGIETIAECMAHEGIAAFLHRCMSLEVLPTVEPVPGNTPQSYLDLIESRFANPEIIDTTRRVAFDGSSRQPGFIVPSIRKALANGQPVDGLATMSALWMHYCLGIREDGEPIVPNDPHASMLREQAEQAIDQPQLWIGQSQFYGDLARNRTFADAFEKAAKAVAAGGVVKAMNAFACS